MNYSCSLRPNVKNLLTQALNWDLTGDEPTILIVHTHGTEAFTETADTQYDDYGGSYRTKDDRYNMISIGDELTRLLTQAGLSVIHDRTAHDLNDYLDAYDNSRAAVQKYLQQYPSIKMVLDLHRDAAQYADGTQWATSATVNGEDSAQLMFVVGTNARGLNHPNWQTNLSIAEKLNVLMEKNVSGLTRPIDLRSQRFNHDLAMGAMIVEVGAAGNTHPEAMNAISVLAEAIVELAHGSK
jgi:stage II sporulation protein P